MILVDTSVWIDYFNGYPSAEADLLTLCIAEARPVVLAGLVLTETLQGVRDADHAERVRRVLSALDRKSTRLNSSHGYISYAGFCLKKKTRTCVHTQHP